MDSALEENAAIFIGGDFFDAMQGKNDRRRRYNELYGEYTKEEYYDLIIEDAYENIKKYANNIKLIALGNHEVSVLTYSNTNITKRLISMLEKHNSDVAYGEFRGWIKFLLNIYGNRASFNIYYAHSSGEGTAPATRGTLAINRQAYAYPDANIIWNAHNHNAYIVPVSRERLSSKGNKYRDTMYFIRTPGYKNEWNDSGSYAAMKTPAPLPCGCIKCVVKYNSRKGFDVMAHLIIE